MAPPAKPDVSDGASLYERKPLRRAFTPRSNQPRLSPEQASRQGDAVSAALRHFADPVAAMAFLNTDQPALGRPIDRAVENAAGLAAVRAALAGRADPAD